MSITFSGKYALNPDTFGIDFEAIVDGQKVNCQITTEALQDIDSNNAQNSAEQQFFNNMTSIEEIAKKKIRAGEAHPIVIKSLDV